MNKAPTKSIAIICLVIAMGVVSGCADTRRALLKEKGAPDEFEVYTRAPLSLPPDFGLRPPTTSGAEVRAEDDPTVKARIVVTGKKAQTQNIESSSPGLSAIYARTGVDVADPNIRQLLDRETSDFAAEDATVMEGLMFSDEDLSRGIAIDPATEAARIRESKAKGIPLNEGEIPKIERKPRRLLDGVFD